MKRNWLLVNIHEKIVMKICHLTSAHSRYDVRIFIKECSTLAKNGWETHLIVADGLQDETKNDVNIHSVKKNLGSRFSRMTKTVWNVYRRAKQINADVYHFHDSELLFVGLLLKSKGKKIIYDVHEDLPKQILAKVWIKPIFRKPMSRVMKLIEHFCSKKFDAVCCATPSITKRYLNINSRTVAINNFPILNELNSTTSWSNKKNELCYIGGISKIRGIEALVQAMENVDGTLNLAGNISDLNLAQSLRKMPGWKKINELGLVDRKQVKEVLASSKIGIVTFLPVPNHIDAQPNKMFEYMSAGIPVIGSAFPLWKEIIEGFDCGTCVDPEDSLELAKAINSLLSNSSLAEEKGNNGRAAVESKFNWEVQSKVLIGLYEELSV